MNHRDEKKRYPSTVLQPMKACSAGFGKQNPFERTSSEYLMWKSCFDVQGHVIEKAYLTHFVIHLTVGPLCFMHTQILFVEMCT